MALPITNTRRITVLYSTGTQGKDHELQMRVDDSASWVSIQSFLYGFLADISAAYFLSGWRVLSARECLRGSNLSMPLPVTDAQLAAFTGTWNETRTAYVESRYYNWVGRSPVTGNKTKLTLFGLIQGYDVDFRLTVGQLPVVAATVGRLNSDASPLLTVAGNKPVWYSYINQGFNAYWQRKGRG